MVIIILSSIVIYSQLGTADNATYARFVQEFGEVKKGVEAVRIVDSRDDINNQNNSFKRVKVDTNNLPGGFTIIGDGEAYLVDLETIGCSTINIGKDYKKYYSNESEIVKFGDSDVFVYDANGKLFYAKGYRRDDTIQYEDIKSPILVTVSQTVIDSEKTKLTIDVATDNEVRSVTVNGNELSKNEGTGKYETEVVAGNYNIIAEDDKGNTDRKTILVSNGQVVPEDPNQFVTTTVTNGKLIDGVYIIANEKIAHINISVVGVIPSYLYISTENIQPEELNSVSWIQYSETIDKTFDDYMDTPQELYVWVKTENQISSPSIIRVQAKEQKTYEEVEIGTGNIIFRLDPEDENAWAREKKLTIIYPEGMQSNGYESSYTTEGVGFGNNKKIVYTPSTTISITKNETTIKAKVSYKTAFKTQDNVVQNMITVNNIDVNSPGIESPTFTEENNTITARAIDSESGISGYLITQDYYDLKTKKPSVWKNDFNANGNFSHVANKTGTWYLYVTDMVGNIAVKSIKVKVKDTNPPRLDNVQSTRVSGYAVIKASAHDDESGITSYGISENDNIQEVKWTEVKSTNNIQFEQRVDEAKTYYVWVKDADGNTANESVVATLNKFPKLAENYPEDIRLMDGTDANFKVEIIESGDPDEYEYDWYVSKDNGATWDELAGAKSNTYQYKQVSRSDDGNYYKCIVKHAKGNIESRIAKLEVFSITTDMPSGNVTRDRNAVLGGITLSNGASSNTINIKITAVNAEDVYISEDGTKPKDAVWTKFKDEMSYELKKTYTTGSDITITVWVRNIDGEEYPKTAQATIKKSN